VNGSGGTSKITIGPWTNFEVRLFGVTTVTIGGTGLIDELRLYPKGALMTTYTYEPLVGTTTQSDASGKITYYSYDGLGRLHMIQDQYGNILKRYDYEYQTSNQ
jgi:YD repeat-containing protein